MALRLAFMGTPDFAAPALQALLDDGHMVAAVYTQPPRPKGRGQALARSPVQVLAEAHGLPVYTPVKLKDPADQAAFAALKLDLAVVAAYGLLLPAPILAAPKRGCLNIHGSLLPRWRGAAPIQRALLAGDAETGVALMQMEAGLDTGPVYAESRVAITEASTAQSLHDELALVGARLLRANIEAIFDGRLEPVPQPEAGMTYAAKLTKADSILDWRQPAVVLQRQLRALTPWPGVEFTVKGETIKLLAAVVVAGEGSPGAILDPELTVATGIDALRLLKVQRPGRGPVSGAELARSLGLSPGDQLLA